MAVTVLREITLAEFSTGRGESVCIRLVDYERIGRRLDVRKFFTDEAGQKLPTSKGATLRPEWLPKLREALDRFEREVAP